MEKVEVKVTADGSNTVVIRQDNALRVYEPQRVSIEGTIHSLIDFAKKRKHIIELAKDDSHVTLNKQNFVAVLTIGDSKEIDTVFTGKIIPNADLVALNINTGHPYSITALRNALKLKRFLFRSREEQAIIVSALEKFNAATSIEFTNTNDYAGNVVYSKISKCSSNLPLEFTLKTALFVGYDPVEIAVTIEVLPVDGSLVLNLISQDYIDKKREVTDSAFNELADELAYIPLVYC